MKNEKGSAIAYALVVIVILGMLLSNLLTFISSRLTAGYRAESKQEALQVAEAGVFFYRWYLAHNTDGRTAQQIDNFWSGTPIGVGSVYEDDFEDPWGDPIGRYQISIEPPIQGSTIANATVVGWTNKYPLTKRTIKIRFRRPSWSENIVLADDDMRFGNGTTVSGKIHSNKGIRFDGLALGNVSSTLGTYNDPDHLGGNEIGVHTHKLIDGTVNDTFRAAESNPASIPIRTDVFPAGRRILVPEIPFNTLVSDLGFMRAEAAIKYDNAGVGRRIILKENGNFDTCKVNSYSIAPETNCGSSISLPGDATSATNAIINYFGTVSGATGGNAWKNGTSCFTTAGCIAGAFNFIGGTNGICTVNLTTAAIPDNGIIFVANNVWVDGVINNKKVTIVAAELDDEPGYTAVKKNIFIGMNNISYTNHDGRDIIGLIAQNNILTIRDSQNFLEIDAALLAKDGKVGRCYYNGIIKNTITINGSLATKIRYGFAYGNTGYINRNLNFDDDLLYYPPPYFPTGSQYAVDLWEEQ